MPRSQLPNISPKGILWLQTLQHLRVIIRSSLWSWVSWKQVQGSTFEMKNVSVMLRASGQMPPHINVCPLLWTPVPNHQVIGHDGVRQAPSERLEHVFTRLGALCTGQLSPSHVEWATKTHSNRFHLLTSPPTSPPSPFWTRQPKVHSPRAVIDPRHQHKLC